MNLKILHFDELKTLRDQGGVVHCHGVFDVLHAGHLAYFTTAKALGRTLVVTLTTDKFVNKGPGRPYFNEKVRAEMLSALEVVDFVCIVDSATATPAIHLLRPDFYVKGPDYKNPADDVTGEIGNEVDAVRKWGGQVVYTDDIIHSSSKILNTLFNVWTESQALAIDSVKKVGGLAACLEALDGMSKLKTLVVGEPILDVYRFVQPQNISSKSPSISAQFIYEEEYQGGAWAICNHLESFVAKSDIYYPTSYQPPKKIRYISHDKSQRIFEVTEIDDSIWRRISPKLFCDELIDWANESDVCLLADFGHGIFEDEVLDATGKIKSFTGLNVQTNSSNYGFNAFQKHKAYDYLSLDLREARLAFHDNKTTPLGLALRVSEIAKGSSHSMTLGSQGAAYVAKDLTKCPAFADQVVDATGAGDAYFAITTMLVKVKADPVLIPFIGNVFAGLKTKIVGNKTSVTKAQLVKALTAILK